MRRVCRRSVEQTSKLGASQHLLGEGGAFGCLLQMDGERSRQVQLRVDGCHFIPSLDLSRDDAADVLYTPHGSVVGAYLIQCHALIWGPGTETIQSNYFV